MNHDRLPEISSALPSRFSRHSAVVHPKPSWLDLIIRHAGSVAVDHTHLLPLNTLEAELKQRTTQPVGRQCC
jgi:hypothetical protein